MFKKTSLAVALTCVAGSAFAAGMSTSNSTTTNGAMSANGGGMSSNGAMSADGSPSAGMSDEDSGTGSMIALFHKLDTNGNGVLSQQEAQADPQVAKLYSSMNTGASIESDPTAKKGDYNPNGVTLNQFVAGMEAARAGSAGPAVSGGKTYTVMQPPSSDQNGMDHTDQADGDSRMSGGSGMSNDSNMSNGADTSQHSSMQ